MKAIFVTGGKQYYVSEGSVIYVEKLEGNQGDEVVFDQVLMVEGKVGKYYVENCLMNQAFVKDPSKTIETVVKEASASMGKELTVKRFVRFEMGEGLEKKSQDFAAEVEAQMKK